MDNICLRVLFVNEKIFQKSSELIHFLKAVLETGIYVGI